MNQQSLQDEINRYTRLSEIILAVSSAKDLETLLTESVKKIYTIFRFDYCWLALINRDSISYSMQQIFSIDKDVVARQDCILLDVGVCGWVLENQQMYLSGNWQPDEKEIIVTDEPSQSILSLPLQVGGQTIGTIAFTAKKQDYFEIIDLEMAVTFTVHMALAIDRWKQVEQLTEINKDLEQRVQQRTQQLRVINRSLQEKITDNEQIQKDLQSSKEKEEEAHKAKSKLLENINNKLRTMEEAYKVKNQLLINTNNKLRTFLNSIIDSISIVMNYFTDKDRDYELLDQAQTAAKESLSVVNNNNLQL
ncbi:GAF domain-containing protein [Candidatus Uabimicrobium sp. HlEnr_7]|uniref:GAF domain-containing protein n=1 Tax=Candidatus Uabimicrobium helgolandensis TaxID=3095367 RepID=UPI003558EF20